MDKQTLIRMANQIGEFFEAMPDREQAQEDIAMHIRKFWEPRMRLRLLQHLNEQQGEGLSDIALAAFKQHRALLE